jgi:hypothetical protein
MTYEEAMNRVRQGKRVKRSGWEDEVFVYYQEGSTIEPKDGRNAVLRSFKGPIHIAEHFDLFALGNHIFIGWQATLSDREADDWEIVE